MAAEPVAPPEEQRLAPAKIMSLRSGTNYQVEEQADEWLAKSRESATKSDYLSHDQLALRQSREVPNHLGVADERLVAGMYRRVFNPLMGKRPKRPKSRDED